jgi:hypothetical protein
MKTITNKEINYSLHNLENFKKELETDISDVIEKISGLLLDYFKFIIENIKLRNSSFSKFIIIRGLDTVLNVFNFILLYTKNLDVTYFHCQKSFYFYVEFVGQISEDEKMFLQLSSRDASTYVYKKTIFDINSELRKSNEEISDYTKLKLTVINCYIEIYKTLLLKLINDDLNHLRDININLLEELYKKLNNLSNKSFIHDLNNIFENLFYNTQNAKELYEISILLIKKINKNPEIIENINNKFILEEYKNKLLDSPDKFVAWFIS